MPAVAQKFKHPDKDYINSFLSYAGAKKKDIRFERIGSEMMIEHEGVTYMVAHVDDFKDQYRNFFEGESYEEIYSEIPDPVWWFLLEEYVVEPDIDRFIVGIYRSWRSMWQFNPITYKDKQWHAELREESWKDLQILIETIKIDWANCLTHARSIDDFHLVPAIAMAIYHHFDDKEDLYEAMAEYFIIQGPALVTHGETFASVVIGGDEEKEEPGEEYYIYNPPYEFDT